MKQHEDLFGIEVTGGGGSAAPDSGRPTERQSTRRSTSDEAHRSADVAATRKVMLDLISQRPRTCDEIVALGFAHQSASAAINWLMRQGHIVPSGEKRRTRMGRRAIVWRHEENPQPLVRTRPTRRELERELAQRDAEVAKANAERDEARRLYCELIATISQTTSRPTQPLNIANLRGWNCFDAKEAKP